MRVHFPVLLCLQVAPKMEKAQKEPKVPAWMRLSAPKPPPQPAPAPGPGTPATARRHVLAWGNARAVQNKQADALPRLAAIRQQGSQKPGQQQPCDARLVAGSAHLLARTQQDEVPMQPHVQVQLRAPRLTRKTLCLSGLGGTLLEATVEGSGEEGTDTGSLGCPDAEHAAKTRTSGNRPGWLAGLQAALKHALVGAAAQYCQFSSGIYMHCMTQPVGVFVSTRYDTCVHLHTCICTQDMHLTGLVVHSQVKHRNCIIVHACV